MAVRLAHPDSSARWSTAIGGFGFVVCFTVAAILYGNGAGRYSDQIVAYYSNQANRLAQIEGFVTLTIGLVLFAVFVAGLRAVATRSEPWSSLMFGTGLATVLCLVIANTLWASSAFTTVIESGYVIDPKSHLLLEDSGFAFLVAGGGMGAAFVIATSLGAFRDQLLPRWLVWLGLPVACALMAVYWYLPLFAFFVWIVLVSVVGLRLRRADGLGGDTI
jgi:hypothetical protein